MESGSYGPAIQFIYDLIKERKTITSILCVNVVPTRGKFVIYNDYFKCRQCVWRLISSSHSIMYGIKVIKVVIIDCVLSINFVLKI